MNRRLGQGASLGGLDERDRRLQVLLSDYEMAREDERTFTNTQGAVLSVAVALLAGIAAFIQSACQFQGGDSAPGGLAAGFFRSGESCRQIPDGLLAVTPLAPLAIFAYLQLLASVATVRSYYLRGLERQIREEVPGAMLSALPGLPAMAFIELSLELASLRRGRRAFRLISALLLLSIVIVFLGFSAYIVLALPPVYAVPAGLFHGASAMLIGREAIAGTVGGRSLFQRLASSYVGKGAGEPLPPIEPVAPTDERSMLRYLVLPRPQDIIKWTFLPIAFLLGALSRGGVSADQIARAVVAWAVIELLVYQARYQWNDIRGFFADQEHPAGRDRRRLPGPVGMAGQRMALSGVVAVARLVLALACVVFLPGLDLWAPVVGAGLAIFAVAVIYEALKARGDGRGGGAFAPVHPEDVALWIVVGSGYAIRGATGLALAGGAASSPWMVAMTALTLWAFGVAFVTQTWALESTSFANATHDRRHVWWPSGEAGRQHILTLARWLSGRPEEDLHKPKTCRPVSITDWRPLHRRTPWTAPWNVAILVSAAGAGIVGLGLARPREVLWWLAPAAVLGCGCAVLVLLASRRHVPVAIGVGAAAFTGLLLLGLPRPGLAVAPWLVVTVVYAVFSGQSWRTLKHPFEGLDVIAFLACERTLRLLVGRRAWGHLRRGWVEPGPYVPPSQVERPVDG